MVLIFLNPKSDSSLSLTVQTITSHFSQKLSLYSPKYKMFFMNQSFDRQFPTCTSSFIKIIMNELHRIGD